jgi:hypothetical protein
MDTGKWNTRVEESFDLTSDAPVVFVETPLTGGELPPALGRRSFLPGRSRRDRGHFGMVPTLAFAPFVHHEVDVAAQKGIETGVPPHLLDA